MMAFCRGRFASGLLLARFPHEVPRGVLRHPWHVVGATQTGQRPGLARFCTAPHDFVSLADLAGYIHAQISGTFKDIELHLLEGAEILGYPAGGGSTQVNMPDAKLLVEDRGACPKDLETYLADQVNSPTADDNVVRDFDDSDDDLGEYDAYQNSKDLVGLAMARGARVEFGRGVRITTANGQVILLKSTNNERKGSWNQLERKRTLAALKAGGIRAVDGGAALARHCALWRKFRTPEEAQACSARTELCLKHQQ
uniref:Uncharacterized protein n=1 Tax=Alexandrium monilatum TaxID=311494 RepID=A0A7S4V8E3_9DINO